MSRSQILRLPRAGRNVFVRVWSPEAPPRALIQIAHGLAEHSGRYARLAGALNDAGLAVYASDHRGHGPECPAEDLGFFAEREGWRECLADLDAVWSRMAADAPGVPRIFMGHSMGSFMGQSFIAEHGAEMKAAVLSGTSGPPPAILGLGRRIAAFERWRLGPHGRSPLVRALLFDELNKPFRPARTRFDWLSRDSAEVDAYIADPLCGFDVTTQLALDLVGALASLASPATAARIPRALPLYILSGARDPVGAKLQGLIDVYRAAGLKNLEVRVYSEARHEMLNETNREEVTADLLAWLDAQLRT